jgi:uncharacterized protein
MQSHLTWTERYGTWALVAGASEGLGAAWASGLAKKGFNLLLLARRESALLETSASLKKMFPVEVQTLAVDLSDSHFIEKLGPLLVGKEIGFYVHNAASVSNGDFLSQPVEDQLRSLDVNCRVPIQLTHLLGTQMANRGKGAIVLMSSLTAFQGTPMLSTYGATKAFNLILAEGLHNELKSKGIDVMACCAGATTTPNFLKSMPQGAPGQLSPEQVVEETLNSLGKTGMMIPGVFNRFASQLMRRFMPRNLSVQILANQAKKLSP